jgi:hypothetical protein
MALVELDSSCACRSVLRDWTNQKFSHVQKVAMCKSVSCTLECWFVARNHMLMAQIRAKFEQLA